MKFRAIRSMLPTTFLVAAISLIFSPRANADIIEVEAATGCPGSLGGGLCNGAVPWLLSDLLAFLSAPNSIGNGTQKYVVTDNIAQNNTSDRKVLCSEIAVLGDR
jgi:hypothetical protein